MADTNPTSQQEPRPVDLQGKIALALSGGGYRAAAFHLGVLDYLCHLDMLKQVSLLSTVSGGTFTGAKYTLSQVEGKSFEEFYSDYYHFLATTNLLTKGLEQLGKGQSQAPSGRRDIAVSMAQVYAETFLAKPDGQPYLFGDILNAKNLSLREVVFNATEFRYGIAFRFQRSADPKAKIGNFKISIAREDAEKVRLADIVTASSCFPGGFEPFAFPTDFVWPDNTIPPALAEKFADGPLALMDGGVYDNQGLQSLLLADDRDPEDLGLFIVSDVDRKSDNLYPYPSNDNLQGGPTLDFLAKISAAFIGVFLITLVTLLHKIFSQAFNWFDFIFLAVVPTGLVAGAIYALIWLRRKVKKTLDKIPLVGRAAWKYIKLLTLDDLIDMVSLRISSLFAMAGSVFMKRVRSLVYSLIYGDFRKPVRNLMDELYGDKRISNLIYHLQNGEPFNEDLEKMGISPPSAALQTVTTGAAEMPTTLWFDEESQLKILLASGQATLCYNLMKFLARNQGSNPEQYSDDAKKLWQKLNEDWNAFNAAPYFLVNRHQ